MPSFDHEILVELLRRAPDVVLSLLGALAVPLPGEANATVVDRAFSEVSLSEIHADLVVLLREDDRPRLVVIVEVQRTVDLDKDWAGVPKFSTETPMIRALFEDIAAWFGVSNPLGAGASHPEFYPAEGIDPATLLLRNL
jgi:hypothetical protein